MNIAIHGYIYDIIQQVKVIVDEKGTEAAAATVLIGETLSYANIQKSIEFLINKTFRYYIKHIKSNTILFSGLYDGN